MQYVQRRARPDIGAALIRVMTGTRSCLHTFLMWILMIVTRGSESSIPSCPSLCTLISLELCRMSNCVHCLLISAIGGDTERHFPALQYLIRFAFASILSDLSAASSLVIFIFPDHLLTRACGPL